MKIITLTLSGNKVFHWTIDSFIHVIHSFIHSFRLTQLWIAIFDLWLVTCYIWVMLNVTIHKSQVTRHKSLVKIALQCFNNLVTFSSYFHTHVCFYTSISRPNCKHPSFCRLCQTTIWTETTKKGNQWQPNSIHIKTIIHSI